MDLFAPDSTVLVLIAILVILIIIVIVSFKKKKTTKKKLNVSISDEIAKLNKLKELGAISEQEFQTKKSELLK